jgi:hypothetical protein
MPELVSRTARIRRGLVHRLRDFQRLMWKTRFGRGTEVTDNELPLPAPSIALNAGDSTSRGSLREVIDALRADDGRLLRLLIKRLPKDGPEQKKLAEILVRHPNLRDLIATGVEEQRVA